MSTKTQLIECILEWAATNDKGSASHSFNKLEKLNINLESTLNTMSIAQLRVVIAMTTSTFNRAHDDSRARWVPKFHEQRNAKKNVIKQLVLARNRIKKDNPGNLYLEISEMDKAICEALNMDYFKVTTEDYERIIGIAAQGDQ